MKTVFTLTFILILSAHSYTQNYYWVGNGGSWSDLSHWATTSGGTTFHTALPGPENNVFFDENSFSLPGQVVTLDVSEALCRNFIATGVTNNPYIQGQGFYDVLNVYGDFILPAGMQRNLNMIYLSGDETVTIETGSLNLGTNSFLQILGNGTFSLQDSLAAGNLYIINGTFHSNSHPIYTSMRFNAIFLSKGVHLGTSRIYTWMWDVDEALALEAQNTTIFYGGQGNFFRTFKGGGHTYNNVVFSGPVELSGNNVFNDFIVLPGASLNIQEGSVQTAERFVLEGNAIENITLGSMQSGSQATLYQAEGEVNASYLVLSDINATGGAVFNALETIDMGNNSGWHITITVPQDYYWVGGSGDWTEASNWATSPGGSTLHESPPSAIDDVFFDAHSFSGSGNIVNLGEISTSCRNLTISGVAENATLQQGNPGKLNVYGSVHATSAIDLHLYEVVFHASGPATIYLENTASARQAKLVFSGSGTYDLLSAIEAWSVTFTDGNFNSNGHPVEIGFELSALPNYSGIIDLSGSSVKSRLYSHQLSASQFLIENTEFVAVSSFTGYDIDIYSLHIDNEGHDSACTIYGSFSVNQLSATPGSAIAFQSGQTVQVENAILEGTPANPIVIRSTIAGSQAYLSKDAGVLEANYLDITDHHAIGGAKFIAHNSTLNNNVKGWNFDDTSAPPVYSPPQALQVYPNPVIHVLHITGRAGEKMTVLNAQGQIVEMQPLNPGPNAFYVNSLKPGLYIISIVSENGQVATGRFSKL